MLIGSILALLTLGFQVIWKLIPLKDWQEHRWQWIASFVLPFAIVLVAHVVWRLITAPWRLHQDQETVASKKEIELRDRIALLEFDERDCRRELLAWKATKPEIAIEVDRVIPKAPKGGVYEMFLLVTATLREPKNVLISEYKLELYMPEGSMRVGEFVDDISEWTLVTEDQQPWICHEMPPMPKEFTQRGKTVRGWLHFRVEAKESQIFGSRYLLNVISPDGANSGEGSATLPEINQSIWEKKLLNL
jgi:hypothetical protein